MWRRTLVDKNSRRGLIRNLWSERNTEKYRGQTGAMAISSTDNWCHILAMHRCILQSCVLRCPKCLQHHSSFVSRSPPAVEHYSVRHDRNERVLSAHICATFSFIVQGNSIFWSGAVRLGQYLVDNLALSLKPSLAAFSAATVPAVNISGVRCCVKWSVWRRDGCSGDKEAEGVGMVCSGPLTAESSRTEVIHRAREQDSSHLFQMYTEVVYSYRLKLMWWSVGVAENCTEFRCYTSDGGNFLHLIAICASVVKSCSMKRKVYLCCIFCGFSNYTSGIHWKQQWSDTCVFYKCEGDE